MKYAYPAIFTYEDENVLVSVPDLKGLHTYGGTMADAIYMAQDAIEMWLWDAENSGEAIPPASKPAELAKMWVSENRTVSMIVADTDEYRRQSQIKKSKSLKSKSTSKAFKGGTNPPRSNRPLCGRFPLPPERGHPATPR